MPAWLAYAWPFRRFELATSLRPDEVERRLSSELDPDRFGLFGTPGSRSWIGAVEGGRLRMQRRIAHRNSFLPVVRVAIAPASHGATLDVRLAMHPLVIAFMAVWMSIACLIVVAGLVALATQGSPFVLFALLFPAAGTGIVAFGFGREARIAEDFLRGALPPAAGASVGPFR